MLNETLLNLFEGRSVTHISSRTLLRSPFRLDASYYSAESLSANALLEGSGFTLQLLPEVSDIYCSSIRERTFVDPEHGVQLLAGHNLDTITDDDVKYVSRVFTRKIEAEELKRGDILISSAGTVGKPDFVWLNHEGKLASQHIIRIRPESPKILPGYLYAFVTGSLGLAMLLNQSAGSVIVTLYTDHVQLLNIPRLTNAAELRIHQGIVQSFEKRARAKLLLKEGAVLCDESNSLPQITGNNQATLCFVCKSTRLFQAGEGEGEYRLTATSFSPEAQDAINNIRRSRIPVASVRDVTKEIRMSPLFVRNFVKAGNGVKYIAGKQILQIRPDFKYISKTETEDLDVHVLHRGWTLMTCAGTVGRIGYVGGMLDRAAAQDVMRVIPNESEIDGGYLNAWLHSDYGQIQIEKYIYGSVIDRISPDQVGKILICLPVREQQRLIGDKIRTAYSLLDEAIELEDGARRALMEELEVDSPERS